MIGDDTFKDCVASLWALIGATRANDPQQVRVAAARALQALEKARGGESYVLLHELDGVIHVNGRQLRLGIDVFAAAQGIAALLRSRGVGEVLFDGSVDADALIAWAQCWIDAPAPAADPDTELHDGVAVGIHASRRDADAEPPIARRRRAAPRGDADAHLRAVFLQHQLIAALTASGPVPPVMAKVVVQAVVDRLLSLEGGLEPLTLLQRDETRLRQGLYVAVLAVVFARTAGFAEERLADLGAAALLHDVGAIVDPAHPGPAGFAWLLARGTDEFWLRSAVVARSWAQDHGASLAELTGGAAAAAAFVRLAVEAEGLACRASAGPDAIAAGLHERLHGRLPPELLAVAETAFLGMAG